MSVSITLTFRWPMGHRILGLAGDGAKCENVHGHNWQADIEIPNDDRALEFGAVKAAIGAHIEGVLDHGFMVGINDPFLEDLVRLGSKHVVVMGQPDTETVAEYLAEVAHLACDRQPLRVHVLEGYRNAATWTRDE